MTSSQLQNDWSSIKGKLKQQYGQLTDDDLTFVEGKGEELLARLQDRLGLSREELDAKLDELGSAAESKIEQVKAKAGEVSQQVRSQAGAAVEDLKQKAAALGEEAKAQGAAAYDEARVRVRGLWEDGEEYVRTNPRESMLAALAAGVVAGLIFLRR